MAIGTIAGILTNPRFGLFQLEPASIEGLEGVIDAIPEERHSYEVSTTDYPVETGGNMTDNAYILPRALTLRVFVSNYLPLVGGLITINTRDRAVEAWERIRAVAAAREPVQITTLLETYPNMLITGMYPIINQNTGLTLSMDMTLKQVIFADTEITQLPPARVSGPASDRTSTTQGGMKQSPEESNPSLLRSAADFFGS